MGWDRILSALFSPQIANNFEEVFKRENLTLDDILDEDGVVFEFKKHNQRLYELFPMSMVFLASHSVV